MNTLMSLVNDCVAALIKAHPAIEDIWLLEANAANECGLEKPANLIVIVPDGQEAHVLEQEMRGRIERQFEGAGVDVFVFPLAAIDRIPRPLMVKMALTSGRNIYCR